MSCSISRPPLVGFFENIYKSRSSLSILLVLSLTVGIFAFSMTTYKCSTLTLEAKTAQKEVWPVVVESPGRVTRLDLEINDDSESVSSHTLELPAVDLNALKIAPLVGTGKFEIVGITLASDTIHYAWDQEGICSQQTLSPQRTKWMACQNDFPKLTTSEDTSIVISSIPPSVTYASTSYRLVVSFASSALFFICGVWLLRPCSGFAGWSSRTYVKRALLLLLTGLYCYQFYLIWRYSIDVPWEDEWSYFEPNALPRGFTWQWLVEFHNTDHRIVLTKLMAWLNFKLFDLNFAVQRIVNYIIFGFLLIAVNRFKDGVTGENRFILFPAYMVFLVSQIAYENHVWAFQSQIHFALLFAVIMIHYAYDTNLAIKSTVLFSLAALLAVYSFAAGVVFAVIVLFCRTLYVIAGIVSGRFVRNKAIQSIVISWVVIGGALILWFNGYKSHENVSQTLFLFNQEFWDYFFNLLSLGFGIEYMFIIPGILCLAIIMFPLVLLIKYDTRWDSATWKVLTAILMILAALAVISIGRSSVYSPKTSRYAEIGFLLIPFVALAWWLAVRVPVWRYVVLSLFWIFCCVNYADDWSADVYRETMQIDVDLLNCIERYSQGRRVAPCQGAYWMSPERLASAKRLHAHFTRSF